MRDLGYCEALAGDVGKCSMRKAWWMMGCVLNLRGYAFGKEKFDD
jgi:hypothetical protein